MNFWTFVNEVKGDIDYAELSGKLELTQPYDLTNSTEKNLIPSDHIVRKIAAALQYDPEELIERAHNEKETDPAKKSAPPPPKYSALRNELLNNCSTMNLVEEIFSYQAFGKMEQQILFVLFYYTIYVGEKLFRSDRAAKFLALHHPALDIEKEREDIGFFASIPPKAQYFQEWLDCLEKYYAKEFTFPEFPDFPSPNDYNGVEEFQAAMDEFNQLLTEHAMLHSLYLSCIYGMESIKVWHYFPQTKSIKIIDNDHHDFIYFLPSLNVTSDQSSHSSRTNRTVSSANQLTIPIVTDLASQDDLKKCFEKKTSNASLTIAQGIFAIKVTGDKFKPVAYAGQTILYSFLQKPTDGDIALVQLDDNSAYLCRYRITHESIVLQTITADQKDVRVKPSQISHAYKVVGIWYK